MYDKCLDMGRNRHSNCCLLLLGLWFLAVSEPSGVFSSPVAPSGAQLPCSNSVVPCGQPKVHPVLQRVVGGHEAVPGSWPWNVILVENGRFTCGAFIISEHHLLSAAHCFDGPSNDPSRWLAVAGRHRLDRYSRNEVIVKIKKITIHGSYDNVTIANDIALLMLEKPLTFTAHVRPVCLPTSAQNVVAGTSCVLSGWGTTQGTGDNRVLNQVVLPVIPDSTCGQLDWYGPDFLPNITFCAGFAEGGKDACTGDSGSPLVCLSGSTWYAQGISSWGSGCARKKWPGIYTEVSRFIPWVKMAIEADQGPCNVVG